jgi:hypothetical protein
VAVQQGHIGGTTKTKTKKKASATNTAEPVKTAAPTSSEAPFVPKDPFEIPPAPNVDWSKRKLPVYDAEKLKTAVTKAGYEIRRDDVIDSPSFKSVQLTVTKPPCGGSVLYYSYADEATAIQAETMLKDLKTSKSRVIRNGTTILQLTLARIQTPEGDPACHDPLGVALTTE